MKRFLSLFLFAILIGSSAMAYDFSAVCSSGQTLYYTITSSTEPYTVQVVPENASSPYYSTNPTGDLVIPTSVTNSGKTYSVTSIRINAFNSCDGLTSVTIPNSVTDIGAAVFYNCSGLTTITIPNSVTSIGINAFKSCIGLTEPVYNANCFAYFPCGYAAEYTIPDGIQQIVGSAFSGCRGLTSITIPNSVTSICDYAFSGCRGLTSVTIGNYVESIGDYAFQDCSGLTTVNFNATNCTTMGSSSSLVFNGCTSFTTLNIGENVANIPAYAFCNCSRLTSITIPNSVTRIGESAFSRCSGLREVTIPNSVTYIGGWAFQGCSGLTAVNFNATNCRSMGLYYTPVFRDCTSLQTINIGSNVTNIPPYAFYHCDQFASVTIPNSVTSIGNNAFSGCSGLTSVTIGNYVESIGDYAFSGCSGLTGVTIPNSVTRIGESAFSSCSGLTSFTIPNSVTSIGDYAFYNCSGLTTVNFNATNCTTMGSSSSPVFNGCTSLTTLNIGENVTNIPNYAFKGCSGLIGTLTIPNSVTSIGSSAFSGCSGLTSVTIPNSVTSIGANAFYNCSNIANVSLSSAVTNIGASAFYNCNQITSITIPNAVTSIGNSAFQNCTGLTTLNFNATNCTTMGSQSYPVFSGCTALSTLNIGENVVNIPEYAFSGCYGFTTINFNALNCTTFGDINGISGNTNITTLNIGENVTNIPNSAFSGCSGLTSVAIPNSVTSIGTSAFYNCNNLSSITIPNAVSSIGNSAFQNCTGITSVNFNATNCTSMGSSSSPVFSGCSALQTINIGNNVTNIPAYAFYNCSGISEIIIPNSVTGIGSMAFTSCHGLTEVTIPNSVTSIGNSAFRNCTGLTTLNFNATNCTTMGNSSYPVFTSCTSLTTLNIGENVTKIPDRAFNGCSGLTTVNFNAVNCTTFGENDGIKYNTNITTLNIGENVTNIPYEAFYMCSGLSSITIPNSVTSIGGSAFSSCSGLTEVTIPNSVTSIGNSAFQNCTGITSVNYNATNCTTMGSSSYPVFGSCNANATISIGANVTKIPAYAFNGLRGSGTLNIPETVTSIGNYAFSGCSGLTEVTIPNSVTSIGNSAFRNCTGLTTLNFNATNCTSMGSSSSPVFSGCSALQTINIGSNVTNIPAYAFYNCNRLSSITIPNAVTSIGNSAFQNCTGLTTLNFNATNCTSIGSSSNPTFSGCTALQTINIGSNVTNIPAYAFIGCSGFSSITIPTNVQSIGESAFQGCTGLEAISIPSSVTSIGASALGGCIGLTSVTIPYIGNRADVTASDTYRYPLGYLFGTSSYSGGTSVSQYYYGSSASSTTSSTYYIPSSLRSVTVLDGYIPYGAFQNCSMLTSITIPTSITAIEGNTFYGCSGLTSIAIPTSVTSIGANAFYNCSNISNVSLPSAVANIGASAFYNCNRLSSITIPNAVTSIGNSAFQNCTGITSVNYNATNCTSMGSSSYPVFGSCNANATISIGANVTKIPAYAFNGLRGSGTLNIPETITSIGNYAFSGCSGITTANLPDALQSIPAGLFYECSGLRSVNIPTSASSIGNYAFYGCNNLNGSIAIPNSVTSIGANAFYNCNAISSLSIGSAVSSIGSNAFYNCSGLSSITVDASNTTYDSRDNCNAIITKSNNSLLLGCNNTVIPETVRSIGTSAFYNCSSLRRVNIPQQLTSLGNDAFAGCSAISEVVFNAAQLNSSYTQSPFSAAQASLRKISLGETVTRIPDYMFAGCTAIDSIVAGPTVPPTIYSSTFDYNHVSSARVLVPCRTADIYNDADFWYNFRRIKQNEPCPTIYTVTALSNNNLFGTVTGGGEYEENSTVTLSATANYGYRFAAWNDGNEENPRTISVTNDVTYIATFVEIPPVATYTITALSSNPAVGVVTGGGTYYEGTEVTLTANPNEGYAFVSWNDGETLNPRQITVSGDALYIASFIEANVVTNYEVNVASSNLAYGTVSGSGIYSLGNVVEISATAFDGYMFTSWNDGNTENPRSITVIGNAMYVANFAAIPPTPVYTITAMSINQAYGMVLGGGEYEENTVTTLTATAANGYEFTSWNDGNTENPREVTVTRDAIYIAYFDELPQTPTYNITVIASNPNHGEVTGSGEYEENAVATLTATAADGYEFTSWNDGNTENPREVTVTRDAIYIAYFNGLPTTPTYNITVIASNPNHGEVTGSGEYEENAVATLTATATNGYEFSSWNDGNTENPREVTVTRDAIYIAYFDELPQTPTYNITVIASNPNHGEVTGSGEYEENTVATLTATAANGYEFSSWNDGNTENPREVTVTRDAIYIAYFDELPQTPTYNITVIASNPNHGEVTGGGVYEENTEITLTATSFDGYRFDIWSDGNTDSIRTVTVTSDAIYIANFVHIDEAATIYVTVVDTACGSYTWNNVTYTESGTYYRTFTAANSADSIVALGLVILPLPEPVITVDGILDACNQETASVTLSAGNYSSYNWTTGENSSSIVVTTPGEYFVEVVDSMGCHGNSEGVIVGYSTTLTEAPRIRNLGMNNNGYISLNWTVAQTEGVAGYEVYREDNETNVFRLVKRINNARTKLLIDSTADPSARAYRYKVCAIDSCGGMSPMSEPHKTMHLTINKGIDNTWNLIWSHYEGFELRGYKIIRGTTMANMAEIDVVPSNQNSYTDYSNPYNLGFFYKIMIIKNTRSNEEEEEMLSSNIVDNGYIVMHTVMAAASNPLCGNVTGSGAYPDGTEIVVEATANEGYEFMSWNDGSTQNPRNAIITSDTLFIANFVEIPQVASYNIMVYSSNPAYGTVTGSGTYAEGTEITIAATASSGYEFVSWSDGNRENPRTIIVTEDAMYIATFVEASSIANYTITVISANPTQGIVTGGGTYPEGTVISIEAIANDGYEFISWNDNNFDNPREITVTADAMYIATFVPATGIAENAVPEISVYPNPVEDILNITSSVEITEIEIVNVMGQIVLHNEVNSENAVCDVAGLPSGVYMVRVRLLVPSTDEVPGADIVQMKFVKE